MNNINGNKIMVERAPFEKNNKQFFSYFIKGNVRGKDIKIAIAPPDKGGYAVLDIVFGNSNTAELLAKPFSIKDDVTGKVFSGNTYVAHSVDEDGKVYECPIKPFKKSDKTLLDMLLS